LYFFISKELNNIKVEHLWGALILLQKEHNDSLHKRCNEL